MEVNLLLNPFVQQIILPFLLVFTLIFAILEKTEVLGKEKRQVNAIIGLVVGLILIAFPIARNIIIQLMPFLAVVAVILLVFMLLYAFASGKKENPLNKGLTIVFGIIIGIALIIMIIYASGKWDWFSNTFFKGSTGGSVFLNILVIAVIAGAIIAVMKGNPSGSGKSSSLPKAPGG